MGRHPWVAEGDRGVRFGVQLVVPARPAALPRLMETGRLVESLGFDALFIFDHPALHADPWICLSGLAVATDRIRLGSVVNCALYRHPAHLARLAADLDNLSRGRLILGLGSGWFEPEFRALDIPFGTIPERQAALDEAIAIIEGAWRAEPCSFAGKRFRTTAAQVEPPPFQQPRPPLMIGGSGEQRTLRQVARFADACNVQDPRPGADWSGFADAASVARHKFEVLRGHCAAVGRPYDEILRTHFTLNLILAPTEVEAVLKRDRIDPSRSTSPGTRRDGRASLKAGTPERFVAYYRSLVEAGAQYFVVQLDAEDDETIRLLATEVMPAVG